MLNDVVIHGGRAGWKLPDGQFVDSATHIRRDLVVYRGYGIAQLPFMARWSTSKQQLAPSPTIDIDHYATSIPAWSGAPRAPWHIIGIRAPVACVTVELWVQERRVATIAPAKTTDIYDVGPFHVDGDHLVEIRQVFECCAPPRGVHALTIYGYVAHDQFYRTAETD